MLAEINMIFPNTNRNYEQAKQIKCPVQREKIKVIISSKPKETVYKSFVAGTALVVSVLELLVG